MKVELKLDQKERCRYYKKGGNMQEKKILVVEDSTTTSRVLRTTLHDLGYYYVETAADGVEALQK